MEIFQNSKFKLKFKKGRRYRDLRTKEAKKEREKKEGRKRRKKSKERCQGSKAVQHGFFKVLHAPRWGPPLAKFCNKLEIQILGKFLKSK